MDHDGRLAALHAPGGRDLLVEDLVHRLQLQEVVAGAQAADLRVPALHRPLADGVGAGARDGPALLDVLQVLLGRLAALHQPGHTLFDQVEQLARREAQGAAIVGALRDAAA